MRKLIAVIAALAFTLAVAGCSDDEDSESEVADKKRPTTTTTETPPLDPEDIDTEASPYCATWAEIRAAGGPGTGSQAIKEHYRELIPKVEQLLTQAPSEIESAVETAVESTKKVAASGSLDEFQRPEAQVAQKKLTQYAADNCAKK